LPARIQPIDPLAQPTLHTADSAVAAVGVTLLPFRPEPRLAMQMKEHFRAAASEAGQDRQVTGARWVGAIPQAWVESRMLSQLLVPSEIGFIDAPAAVARVGFTIADLYGPPAVVSTVRRWLRRLAAEETTSIGGFSYPSRANESWQVFEIFMDKFEEIRFTESTPDAYRSAVEEAVERLGLTIESRPSTTQIWPGKSR
jgi:hypothetical protein